MRREETVWTATTKHHSEKVIQTLLLYFRGHMSMFDVETQFKKLVCDCALLTDSQKVKIDMEVVGEFLNGMKISVPRKFDRWGSGEK